MAETANGGDEQERDDRGVLCPRCDHLSKPGATVCEDCGAELFIACDHCGHLNQRVFSRCQRCRRRLHLGLFRHRRRRGRHRWWRRLKRGTGMPALQVTLVVLVILVFWGILKLVNYFRF